MVDRMLEALTPVQRERFEQIQLGIELTYGKCKDLEKAGDTRERYWRLQDQIDELIEERIGLVGPMGSYTAVYHNK